MEFVRPENDDQAASLVGRDFRRALLETSFSGNEAIAVLGEERLQFGGRAGEHQSLADL